MKSSDFNRSFPELGSGGCPSQPSSWTRVQQKKVYHRHVVGHFQKGKSGAEFPDLAVTAVMLECPWRPNKTKQGGTVADSLSPWGVRLGEDTGGDWGAHRLLFNRPLSFQKFAVKLLLSSRKHFPTFLTYNLSVEPTAVSPFSHPLGNWVSDCFCFFALIECHSFRRFRAPPPHPTMF